MARMRIMLSSSALFGKLLCCSVAIELLRMRLLLKYGGVWADATTLCLRTMDEWLPSLTQTELFFRREPDPKVNTTEKQAAFRTKGSKRMA